MKLLGYTAVFNCVVKRVRHFGIIYHCIGSRNKTTHMSWAYYDNYSMKLRAVISSVVGLDSRPIIQYKTIEFILEDE